MFSGTEREETVGEVVRMRGRHINDVHIWVRDEGFVGAVCDGSGWRPDCLEESFRFGQRGGRGRCSDGVHNVGNVAGARWDEEIFGEDCQLEVRGGSVCWGGDEVPVAIQPVAVRLSVSSDEVGRRRRRGGPRIPQRTTNGFSTATVAMGSAIVCIYSFPKVVEAY